MDALEKLISRLVRLSLSFPKATLLCVLLVTAIAGYMTGLIKIRTNFSDLLPDNNPIVLQAKELEKIVGGASFVVVAVEAEKTPAANEAAGKFLDDLKAKLAATPGLGIRYIDDRPPTGFLKKASLLYLSLEDLDRLHDKIKLRIDQAKLKKMKLLIDFGAQGGFDEELENLKTKYSTYVNPTSHYQNKDGTLLASLIKPDWRTTEVSRTEDLVSRLDGIIAELSPERYDPSLNIRLTGPYVKQLNQKNVLLRDAAVVSAISFIGSILYLVVHFRRKRAVFLIGVPLTVSTIWAMGFAYLVFGSLNLFSSASCAILLGLGAEFGIHFYTEYLHERRLGREAEDALSVSMTRLGRAFLAASSTTAAAFFALAFTRFKALHELGIISGTGILLCGLAFVFMLPPLTLLLERWSPDKKMPKADWEEKKQSFSRSSMRWIFSRKNLVVTGLIFLATLVSVALGHLRFDYNLNHVLGSQDTKELDGRIDGIFNHSVNPEVALARSYEDASKLAQAIRQVQEKNAATPRGTTIKGALALSDFIPADQAAKREKLYGIQSLFTPTVLKYMGDEDRKSYEQLEPMLNPPEVTLQGLPEQITNKFIDKTGSLGRLAFVFPNFEPTQADRFMRFVDEIREVKCPDCAGDFYASGESTVFYEIVRLLSREGRYVIGFTVLMILGALWINFRSVSAMFLVFAPLLLGIAATLGVMGLIGLPFNIINVAAIPIIIGTTDDYGVHLYQRINDDPQASLHESYRMTFRPIVGSALSALIGFGSLGFAQMGGIRSFGLVSVVGITLCTMATLFWFPALLAFAKKKERSRMATPAAKAKVS
ncbi:MAG TPA: MMPL family transporter [bacterium]|nr:MMPL family transporter [bacterium]